MFKQSRLQPMLNWRLQAGQWQNGAQVNLSLVCTHFAAIGEPLRPRLAMLLPVSLQLVHGRDRRAQWSALGRRGGVQQALIPREGQAHDNERLVPSVS